MLLDEIHTSISKEIFSFVIFQGRGSPNPQSPLCNPTYIKGLKSIFFLSLQEGHSFPVPAGSLGFSVIVYTVCAIIALTILVMRHFLPIFGKAELGGPQKPKIISGVVLMCLWVIYVLLSSLQTKGYIQFSL